MGDGILRINYFLDNSNSVSTSVGIGHINITLIPTDGEPITFGISPTNFGIGGFVGILSDESKTVDPLNGRQFLTSSISLVEAEFQPLFNKYNSIIQNGGIDVDYDLSPITGGVNCQSICTSDSEFSDISVHVGNILDRFSIQELNKTASRRVGKGADAPCPRDSIMYANHE